MSKPQSVLLLIADDWSPISRCYGNDVIRTPRIDRTAEEGMVFTRAFCTSPSCAASRANILTGLYSHHHGQYGHSHSIHNFRTREGVRSLPALLNEQGVFTGLIGKDHIAPRSVYPFQHYDAQSAWHTGNLGASARAFFTNASGKPFFLHAASMFPHRTGADFQRSFGDGQEEDVRYRPEEVVVPEFLPDVPEVRRDLADYYTFVTRYDRFVGVMLDELERAGRADDTLVLVMSDHGMPFPGAKASGFNTGHHCPLIIRHPRAPRGRTDAMVNWTDIAPTIADFLGVPAEKRPAEWTGRSVLPVLEDPGVGGWEQTFFAHTFHEVTNYYPYRAAMSGRYKYIRNLAYRQAMPLPTDLFDSPTWQAVKSRDLAMMGKRRTCDVLFHPREALYDVVADPMETTNRIGQPELRVHVEQLKRALTDLRIRTRDPWLEIDYQEGDIDRRIGPA